MPATTVNAGMVFFEYKGQGWSERYIFKQSVAGNLGQAIDTFIPLIYGRTAFLGKGVKVIFARVFNTDAAKKAREVPLPYPLGPHPSWGGTSVTEANIGDFPVEPNDAAVCVQQRFETDDGSFWQRYFRGIPDSWVVDKDLACGIGEYFAPRPSGQAAVNMTPAGNANHKNVCQSFWTYLLANTAYAHKVTRNTYELAVFNFITYRKVANKKTGRPFGVSAGRRPSNLVR